MNPDLNRIEHILDNPVDWRVVTTYSLTDSGVGGIFYYGVLSVAYYLVMII